jgi:hypothetical protein
MVVQKAFRISGQCNRVQAEPANSKLSACTASCPTFTDTLPTDGCFFGGPKKQKNGVMEKSAQEQIKAKLRAKIAEWTAEETEHWFCGSARNEGDLNDYLETLDMVVSDLKERIAYDDKPSLHRAEASTVLDELPHLKATLTEYDYQVIARMVAQAKVKSLQATRAIILGGNADWLSITSLPLRLHL